MSGHTIPSGTCSIVGPQSPPRLSITMDGGEELVSIDMTTGDMRFGPGYTPNAAARAFWEVWSTEYRAFRQWKNAQALSERLD